MTWFTGRLSNVTATTRIEFVSSSLFFYFFFSVAVCSLVSNLFFLSFHFSKSVECLRPWLFFLISSYRTKSIHHHPFSSLPFWWERKYIALYRVWSKCRKAENKETQSTPSLLFSKKEKYIKKWKIQINLYIYQIRLVPITPRIGRKYRRCGWTISGSFW